MASTFKYATKEQCEEFLKNNWGFRGIEGTGVTFNDKDRSLEQLRAECESQKATKEYANSQLDALVQFMENSQYFIGNDLYQFYKELKQ